MPGMDKRGKVQARKDQAGCNGRHDIVEGQERVRDWRCNESLHGQTIDSEVNLSWVLK